MRLLATSLPAAASVRAKAISHSPEASRGMYRSFCSSEPARVMGSEPSFWTMGIRLVVASARAISSATMAWPSVSSAVPPCRSSKPVPSRSCLASSSFRSQGNSALASISAARGAIRSTASSRTMARSSSCSAVGR